MRWYRSTDEMKWNKQQNFSRPRLTLLSMLSVMTHRPTKPIFIKWGTWTGLVSEASTWSFITWAGIWKDHWFVHTVGWHRPEASDHWLGSAGLIIYPVEHCLCWTALPPSIALSMLGYFTMQRSRRQISLSPNDAVALSVFSGIPKIPDYSLKWSQNERPRNIITVFFYLL